MDRASLIAAMQAVAAEKPRAVAVPKWGTVHVRQLTVAEVDAQAADTAGDKDDKNRIARGACRVLCDELGQRLFDPDKPDDVALLAAQPWALLRTVLQASEGEDNAAAGTAKNA
jgi:hypothetical protein